MNSLLLGLHHLCGQQYSVGIGRQRTYVFILPSLPPMLLLVVAMVDTCCDSAAIIFCSASVSLDIVELDPLSVKLAWVISAKVF